MDYLLKASAILVLFYISYQLFLQRETFFQANRLFLLSGLIFAFSMPWVVIPIYVEYTPIDTSVFITTTSPNSSIPVAEETPYDFSLLLQWIYLIGILFFFGKLGIEFLSLRKLLKTSKRLSSGDVKILETNKNISPFSFFNKIVYNPDQFKEEELTHIINHEKVHTNQWHSIDTLIAQLACVLFWFNPIAWYYKKALQQNLEFIADQKAQHVSDCKKSYQTVLLKTSVQNHPLAITNHFYTSLIKKRIVMLHKSKSKKTNLFKLLIILPLLAGFMMSFNTKNIYVEKPSQEASLVSTLQNQTETIEISFNKDMSDNDLNQIKKELSKQGITFDYSDLKRNAKGEIIAIKTQFSGYGNSATLNLDGEKPIQPFQFIKNDDTFGVGQVTSKTKAYIYETKDGQTKVQSSKSVYFIDEEDDEDNNQKNSNEPVIKVRQSHHIDTVYYKTNGKPTWISKDGTQTNINATENGNSNVIVRRTSTEPIFIVDGKVVDKSSFEDVDSDDINSVNVLKGKSATATYGNQGKNGVVIMSTKNAKPTNNQMQTSNALYFNLDGNENPIYILNGEVISKKDLDKINPTNILSIDVLKDMKAVKLYGEKGKNGVVVINSTTGTYNTNQNELEIIKVEKASPWKIKTQVSSIIYEDDNGEVSVELVIDKNASDAFLEQQKNTLKSHGIEAKFSKVRRNKAGEITSIKIALDDNQGRKSSATWKEKDQAIPDIVMGKSKDDKLYVRAIGN